MKKKIQPTDIFKTVRKQPVDTTWIASWRTTLEKHVADHPITRVQHQEHTQHANPFSSLFLQLKPMIPLILAIAVVLGGGSTAAIASQNDVPGEALYNIKLATEEVREAMTFSKEKKAELKAQLAIRRADELTNLVGQDAENVSGELVAETAKRYSKLVHEVKNLTKDFSAEARLALAPGLAKRISETAEKLETTQEELGETTTTELDEALEDAVEAEDEILESEKTAAEEEPALTKGQERAAGKIKAATNKLNSVTRYVTKFNVTTEQASTTLGATTALLAEAEAFFAAGSYDEAFVTAQTSIRAANEAKKTLRETFVKVSKERADAARAETDRPANTKKNEGKANAKANANAQVEVKLKTEGVLEL